VAGVDSDHIVMMIRRLWTLSQFICQAQQLKLDRGVTAANSGYEKKKIPCQNDPSWLHEEPFKEVIGFMNNSRDLVLSLYSASFGLLQCHPKTY
jgi:hypothetical protein